MKPIYAIVAALVVAIPIAKAADDAINDITIWNDVRLVTNATSYSKDIELPSRRPSGSMSLQFGVAGTTGTVSIAVQCSNDGRYYAVPDGYPSIDTGISSGTNFYAVSTPICKFIRIRAVATNDGATVHGVLVFQ
jgi:hypothetical protein